jgi:hypothetical protein
VTPEEFFAGHLVGRAVFLAVSNVQLGGFLAWNAPTTHIASSRAPAEGLSARPGGDLCPVRRRGRPGTLDPDARSEHA